MASSSTEGENMDSDIDVHLLPDIFWEQTDVQRDLELKPSTYHLWGIKNQILEKSQTLKNLVMTDKLEVITNYQKTYQDVLTELGLQHRVVKVSGKRGLKGVIYEIQNTPPWTFGHFDESEDGAAEGAAKRALNYFMVMAK